ncbi:MAG: NAD(P)(+) transhydrogenase (Re/Si-specific) subunit beta, partial [Eggerthellaceae bacterium]|nr:NAD(P)(+) transhydrogenase (Re/Si-specific) subunit beta [Eggerthellaceae bacterium]
MNETLVVVETFTTDTVSAVQDMLSRGQSLAYIVAALLFILALAGLSKQKSAMRGNVLGIIGMVVALAIVIVATTIEGFQFPAYTVGLIIVAMLIGAAIGVWKARRVQMTAMPELVALLHSFVGAAAVLVGINSFLMTPGDGSYDGAFH